jgi:DNA-binding NarL/FixJ family response regulator
MGKKINVMIVDDHAILRAGLKQVLSEAGDIDVVAEGGTANDAIKLARSQGADVMLLDITLPDRSGIEALQYIKKDNPHLSVLMLSMHREDQYALRALKAGASGYLCKQSASDELVDAVRMVAKGKKYISPAVAEILANQVTGESEKPLHETLSNREYETLLLIASGQSVSEIAEKLSLSVKTISMYRTRLLEKMQLKHNAELTHYAIKNNLVD